MMHEMTSLQRLYSGSKAAKVVMLRLLGIRLGALLNMNTVSVYWNN